MAVVSEPVHCKPRPPVRTRKGKLILRKPLACLYHLFAPGSIRFPLGRLSNFVENILSRKASEVVPGTAKRRCGIDSSSNFSCEGAHEEACADISDWPERADYGARASVEE